jgi:hypothetical protein
MKYEKDFVGDEGYFGVVFLKNGKWAELGVISFIWTKTFSTIDFKR